MKKLKTFILLAFIGLSLFTNAQTFVQKANYTGTASGRGIAFGIGNKGYYGTGVGEVSDMWSYDPSTNNWTSIANLPNGMQAGIGFSIGNKGYAGCGWWSGNAHTNFWEYDPIANTWTAKANYPGTAFNDGVGFSIGSKGYAGIGARAYTTPPSVQFYEYDPSNNTWVQKTDFTGGARRNAAGNSISNFGYVGVGQHDPSVSVNYTDFYKFDVTTNSWSQIAVCPANSTSQTGCGKNAFVINNMLYLAFCTEMWSYDPSSNSWSQILNYPITAGADGNFVINGKGYIIESGNKKLWEFTPCTTPSQAATPTGTTSLCINPSNTSYTTTGAINATEYVWEISPAGAGTITGTGTTGIVDWNNTYSGNATIRVKGTSGTACVGDFSNGLTVNINPLPIVSLLALNSVCINASSFSLSGGSPSGGNYSGNGVSVNTFNPSVAGVGSFPINYTYTDGNLCSNSAIQNITVNPLPIVSINAFPSFVNYYATPYTLTGNPSGGVFSGAGINGLNFNPQSAGLGSKTISYNYSDANNCSNSANISTIVYDTTGVVCTTNDTTFVTVTDTTYISVTDTLIIDAVLTGLTPPNNINTLKIYPNPALTHIYIDNGNYALMNGYSIRIDNMLSQTVFSSPINQALFFIDLSSWSGNGLYFVFIIDDLGNTIETRKIIVE